MESLQEGVLSAEGKALRYQCIVWTSLRFAESSEIGQPKRTMIAIMEQWQLGLGGAKFCMAVSRKRWLGLSLPGHEKPFHYNSRDRH